MAFTDEQMAIYRAFTQKRQEQQRDRLRQCQQMGFTGAQQASENLEA